MAWVTTNIAGVVVVLEHDDVASVLAAGAGAGSAVATALGPILAASNIAAPIVAGIIAAVSGYFAIEAVLIKEVDRGNGVYLTLPWPAIVTGQIWLIIPTTRPTNIGAPAGWVETGSGELHTEDSADLIRYQVDHNVIAADSVEFVLTLGNTTSGWAKAIIMPDGQGNEWEIKVNRRGESSSNGLWAGQVQNGQHLTFRKPKMFGIWYDVMSLGGLQQLVGGDRVTFFWVNDN